MSIQQEEGKKPFKPQVYLKRGRGQRRQDFDKTRKVDESDSVAKSPISQIG